VSESPWKDRFFGPDAAWRVWRSRWRLRRAYVRYIKAVRPLPYRGYRFGRLLLTTCRQPTGAPFVDDSFSHDLEGNEYVGKSVLLAPWRRNEYGEHARQRAFTVGWRR
jgi:hypothetical protein